MDGISVDDISGLCRVCFNSGLYNIFSYELQINEETFQLKEIFEEMLGSDDFDTWDINSLPSMLCNDCTDELGKSYAFIKKIRKANEKIKELWKVDCDIQEIQENTSDTGDYDIVEYFEEKDDVIKSEEESITQEYFLENSDEETQQEQLLTHQRKKRKTSKQPNLVLTENVKNILSNAQQLVHDQEGEIEHSEPPVKISIESSDESCFLITKFVPSQSTEVPDFKLESTSEDFLDAVNVSKVCMFDMAAVEVNASGKIELPEDDETNVENPNTMYLCQYCPRAFATSHHLIMHQRKTHVCQFCMKGFSKVADLHKHSREAHNQFNCALCKKDFSSNSNLRQHMKRIHNVELPAHVSLLSFRKKETTT